MRIGSLFAGVGGLELGLEAAIPNAHTIWQVEQAEYPRRVLAKHWPNADRSVTDVTQAGRHNLEPVDLICGGFPCPDISQASRGRGKGIDGPLTGLWRHLVRITDELRPSVVIVENNDGRAARAWLPVVRGALWGIGYTSLPFRVRACDVGAPFIGSRVFAVAAPYNEGQPTLPLYAEMARMPEPAGHGWKDWGRPSSAALGVADGLSGRMDRLRAAGNAVVPQCAYVVGLRVAALMGAR